MIRRSRQFSLSPREEGCGAGHQYKLMLTVCQEPKKSRINVAGYEVFCLLAFCLLHSALPSTIGAPAGIRTPNQQIMSLLL
jgi:hypothetical protein